MWKLSQWLSSSQQSNEPGVKNSPASTPKGPAVSHAFSKASVVSTAGKILEPDKPIHQLTERIFCFVYGKQVPLAHFGSFSPICYMHVQSCNTILSGGNHDVRDQAEHDYLSPRGSILRYKEVFLRPFGMRVRIAVKEDKPK